MVVVGDPVLMEISSDPIPQPSVINTTIQAFREGKILLNILAYFKAKKLHVMLFSVFSRTFALKRFF